MFVINQSQLRLHFTKTNNQSWVLFQPNPMQVSFHLPLHRYFAVFVSQAVKNQGHDLAELLPSNDFLQMALIHPLQLQVMRLG